MCRDCGCQEVNQEHEHWVGGKLVRHSHGHAHSGVPRHIELPRKISVEESVLAKNDRIAAENRKWFARHHLRSLNLISSPGSGKTLLLEKTVSALGSDFKMAILTGDQEGDFDTQRLKAAGAEVLQLHTASSCHLDASMIQKQLDQFVRPDHELLVIENVGNLVCPAAFDLGESQKVALLSCTEGEDKPSKYPLLFHEASVVVLTKMDLVPHLDWNLELCERHIRRVNAHVPIFRVSARTGQGLDAWFDFVRSGKI